MSKPKDYTPYCRQCEHDLHLCHGCGKSIYHGEYACDNCNKVYKETNE